MEVLGTLFSFLYTIAEFALVIYLIFFLPKKIKKKKQEEAAKQRKIAQENEDRFYEISNLNKKLEDNIKTYRNFIYNAESRLDTVQYYSFEIDCAYITNALEHVSAAKKVMLETAAILEKDYHQENPIRNFDWCDDRIKELENVRDRLNRLCIRSYQVLDSSKMMESSRYGKHDQAYWHRVCNQSREKIVGFITEYKENCKARRYEEIAAIDLEKALVCIWFFAIETPFSVSDYQNAKQTFLALFPQSYIDIILADLYSKQKLGGEDAIREDVKQLIEKNAKNGNLLTSIASGLMWMKAYESEQRVLQHMLSSGLEMSMPLQQRLHALANGGGKSDNVIEISSEDDFCFDVSPLAWKDNDYSGLFDNLAFRGKTLTYSLAIRDEDTELIIPSGIAVPKAEDVQHKLTSVLTDEYDDSVASKVVDSVAISGGGKEKLTGVLVTPEDCKQMGILIHVAKIGRKLTIKLYTLFLPANTDVSTQKQQALSLYNKLSPSAVRWESSLKEMILVAVQQLLNERQQSGNSNNNTAGENGPVF